jgi:hypothetical protein
MTSWKWICVALMAGLLGCQEAGTDGECAGKCDDLDDSAAFGKLMPRAPETPGIISISRNEDSWFCEVIGARGDIVLLSEEYTTRASALNGALAIEENGVDEARYQVLEVEGGWGFVLRAGNNVVLADSQVFASEAEGEAAAALARDLVAGIVQYKAAVTSGARFELGRDGSAWDFTLRDADGTPLLVSQTYSRRRDAITGIESVRNNGKDEGRYVVLDSPPRFILKAANGEEIGESSTTFASAEDAQAAVSSLRALLASERVANPW